MNLEYWGQVVEKLENLGWDALEFVDYGCRVGRINLNCYRFRVLYLGCRRVRKRLFGYCTVDRLGLQSWQT